MSQFDSVLIMSTNYWNYLQEGSVFESNQSERSLDSATSQSESMFKLVKVNFGGVEVDSQVSSNNYPESMYSDTTVSR